VSALSVGHRLLFSIGANMARAALSLITGLLVARGLGPSDYGNLAYLLGSFWAIRALLDLGSGSAFYTFIAQQHRGRLYYLVYFGWLGFQFLFSAGLVAQFLPQALVDRFWLGQSRDLILLALVATFLQNQVWQTVVQIHEAARMTVRIQVSGLLIISTHVVLVLSMLWGDWLSVRSVLSAIIVEYLVGAVWLSSALRKGIVRNAAQAAAVNVSLRDVVYEYLKYCRPMMVIAVFTFFYEMTDRWLLQRFGGSSQQGFYQVAAQLSTISLLATSSVLNILWKEVAEACGRGEDSSVIAMHQKATRFLMLLAAGVSCFLAPWAEHLVVVLLGEAYHASWPVLFLMLFYPVHQTMGQINGTLFMATGRTHSYMKVAVSGLVVSVPVSYFLIGPKDGVWVSGMDLGALGLAIKMVCLNILFVNIQAWMISRQYNAAFRWYYQVLLIATLLLVGFCAMRVVQGFFPELSVEEIGRTELLYGLLGSGVLYVFVLSVLLIYVPFIVGVHKDEVLPVVEKVKRNACAILRKNK
jgi:O-antigen/teichoic acid export membrane protein